MPDDKNDQIGKSDKFYKEYLKQREAGEDVDPEEFITLCSKMEENIEKYFEKLKSEGVDEIDLNPDIVSDLKKEQPPQTIGDFKIISEIGSGGMGTVYEAQQISLKRKVALKVLPPYLSFSDDAVLKFKREAEAGGRQSHPGIVAVYAVGEEDGVHYIAQELIEGGRNLADRLAEFRKEKQQPTGYFRMVAQLIVEVAGALHSAHSSGVIHRDVKPSNILLTPNGIPKITDFGLAKVEDALALSRTGDFAGTPYYMSPEQAMSQRIGIDHRTDIFSLGVTLYEMLTLERPFEGETSQEVLRKIMLQDPRDPRKVNDRVPRDLAVISLKAMEKLPASRYETMEEFAGDLRRFLSGDVIKAKPAGPVARLWKRARRSPAFSTVLGVAALSVLALIVSIPWYMASLKVQRDKAVNAEKIAADRYNQVLRLSDAKRLSQLVAREENLWPAVSENTRKMKDWLDEAERLSMSLPMHKQMLEELRSEALPYDEETRKRDRETHPGLKGIAELLAIKKAYELSITSLEKESESTGDDSKLKSTRKKVAEITARISHLKKEILKRRTWKFKETGEEKEWQHGVLAELVDGIEKLAHKKTGTIRKVRERLEFSETIDERSVKNRKGEWDRAATSIADKNECPLYDGLAIKPVSGLVPLGRDPGSGLWEFAHLQTGVPPERDPEGNLLMKEECGIVFVLIPGGSFRMGSVPPEPDAPAGSPNVDPLSEMTDQPVHTVTLQPFFLSKYEMTQGQWLRITDRNPSEVRAGSAVAGKDYTLLHPVEMVSWQDCVLIMSRLNLRLPSEAEWEYAARAGTGTVWWTGNDKESLADAANMLDLYCKKTVGPKAWEYEEWLDDGYAAHAPVNLYRPNPFGLYCVHGNVWEWCQDRYHESYENTPCDGSAMELVNLMRRDARVTRGGSWRTAAGLCRSASRYGFGCTTTHYYLGLRPALSLPD